jgi:hypothetical protein
MFRIRAHILLDLDHELTSRRHHQCAGAAPLPIVPSP